MNLADAIIIAGVLIAVGVLILIYREMKRYHDWAVSLQRELVAAQIKLDKMESDVTDVLDKKEK
jgi:hypothetical protein